MRRVKLSLACSLDQYIAPPDQAIDWIRMDADYGMAEFFRSIDTMLLGRKTYDFALSHGGKFFPGIRTFVFTSNPMPDAGPWVKFIAEDPIAFTRALKKKKSDKDIWLFGGHTLAAALFAADLVDEIRITMHPILLGGGTPLFGQLRKRQIWTLEEAKPFDNGVVLLRYSRA